MNCFLDVRTIDERAFIDEKWLHPIDGILEAFFGKTAAGVTVMTECPVGVGSEDDGAQMLSASLWSGKPADDKFLLEACLILSQSEARLPGR